MKKFKFRVAFGCCLIGTCFTVSSCAEKDFLDPVKNEDGISFNVRSTLLVGNKVVDIPDNFSDFHLYATDNVGGNAQHVSASSISGLSKLNAPEGKIFLYLFANANSTGVNVPPDNFTFKSAISLKKSVTNIPDVCFGRDSFKLVASDTGQPFVRLKRIVSRISIHLSDVDDGATAAGVIVKNMYTTFRMDSVYSGSRSYTFDLKKSEDGSNSFSADSVIIFPSNGNLSLLYQVTTKDGTIQSYTPDIGQPLLPNMSMDVGLRYKQLRPEVQVTSWDDWTKLNPEQFFEKEVKTFALSGMPDDFTATSASVNIDNVGTHVSGSVSGSTLTVSIPSNISNIKSITFYDKDKKSFAVYFGEYGIGGADVSVTNNIIIPDAPQIGSYFGHGVVWKADGNTGYQAYKVSTAICLDLALASWADVNDFLNELDTDGCGKWYIPSKDEFADFATKYKGGVKALYLQSSKLCNLANVSNLMTLYYWTSTDSGDGSAAKIVASPKGSGSSPILELSQEEDASYNLLPMRKL